MTPERWQQVKNLFDSATEREPHQRATFLDEACAGDPDLRHEVESLLAYDEKEDSLIEAPAVEVAAELLTSRAELVTGRRIGPYQVLREIGHGGMGAVYLAVRADDQFQKQVAIKLVKRGMDTDAVLRRFRNEQQILADLDHPNIAKLLDGGTTEDGLSYFIMDYVEGLPIDVYCDSHKLDTLQRLKLFHTVCSAVQYAHQNHVIHRDLKPGNILVTSAGVPKLLDFGIAKLLHPERAAQTVDSVATLRPMTPEYASPEQVRGETVTPASDIYSLGVLLYELLTGHRPYRIRSGTPSEIERVISKEEPEKPSAAIRRIEEVPGAHSTPSILLTPESVSRTRDGSPEKLRHRLAGDLDNIVLTALRKDPSRRYASVEQFSEDIRRHWEGHPVIARKDTPLYRSAKFLKRNKTGVTGVLALIIIFTLINVGIFLWLRRGPAADPPSASVAVLPFADMSPQRDREYFCDGITEEIINALTKVPGLRVAARTSAFRFKSKADDIGEVAKQLHVRTVLKGSVRTSGDRLRITAQLINAADGFHFWSETYERELKDVFAIQDEIARAIVSTMRIKLAGDPRVSLVKSSVENLEAYTLYLKGLHYWNKRFEGELRKSLDYFEQAVAKQPDYAPALSGVAECYIALAIQSAAPAQELMPKAEAAARRALQIDDTLAEAHASLARVYYLYHWNWSAAEREFQRSFELNPNYALAHHGYGVQLWTMARFEEALAEIRRAHALDPFAPVIGLILAEAYLVHRDYDLAIEHSQKALELSPNFSRVHLIIGEAYAAKSMWAEAEAAFHKAGESLGDDTRFLGQLGQDFASIGKSDAARRILADLNRRAQKAYVSPVGLALLYIGLDDKEQAFAWLEKAYQEHSIGLYRLKGDPAFGRLRSDPRFVDLVRRIGLPP